MIQPYPCGCSATGDDVPDYCPTHEVSAREADDLWQELRQQTSSDQRRLVLNRFLAHRGGGAGLGEALRALDFEAMAKAMHVELCRHDRPEWSASTEYHRENDRECVRWVVRSVRAALAARPQGKNESC